MLTEAGCRTRQQRLCELLIRIRADAAIITDPHEIYYFSGVLLPLQPWSFPGVFWLDVQGRSWLVAPNENGGGYVTDRLDYDPKDGATANPDNGHRVNLRVEQRLQGVRTLRLAYQAEAMPKSLGDMIAGATGAETWIAIDDDLVQMEQRKDPDEIELIRLAVQANLAGYTAAHAAIAPGVHELDVLAAGQRAASSAANCTSSMPRLATRVTGLTCRGRILSGMNRLRCSSLSSTILPQSITMFQRCSRLGSMAATSGAKPIA